MFLSTKVHNRVPKVTEGSLNIKTTLLNMITYLGILCQFFGIILCPRMPSTVRQLFCPRGVHFHCVYWRETSCWLPVSLSHSDLLACHIIGWVFFLYKGWICPTKIVHQNFNLLQMQLKLLTQPLQPCWTFNSFPHVYYISQVLVKYSKHVI